MAAYDRENTKETFPGKFLKNMEIKQLERNRKYHGDGSH